MLEDNYGYTLVHYAAFSGKPQTLNQALALSKTPQSWVLAPQSWVVCRSISDKVVTIITNTLLQSLNTNYDLTQLDFNGFPMDKDAQLAVITCLSRNIEIKRSKIAFIAFMQGLSQPATCVSMLNFGNLEMFRHILSYLLPEAVRVEPVLKAIQTSTNHSLRALALIDKEIKRLESSDQKNNTFWGISLAGVYQNSDAKIAAFKELQKIIQDNPVNLATPFMQWEHVNQAILAVQRLSIGFGLFNSPKTRSQGALEDIKKVLGLEKNQQTKDNAVELATAEEDDGFVLVNDK